MEPIDHRSGVDEALRVDERQRQVASGCQRAVARCLGVAMAFVALVVAAGCVYVWWVERYRELPGSEVRAYLEFVLASPVLADEPATDLRGEIQEVHFSDPLKIHYRSWYRLRVRPDQVEPLKAELLQRWEARGPGWTVDDRDEPLSSDKRVGPGWLPDGYMRGDRLVLEAPYPKERVLYIDSETGEIYLHEGPLWY